MWAQLAKWLWEYKAGKVLVIVAVLTVIGVSGDLWVQDTLVFKDTLHTALAVVDKKLESQSIAEEISIIEIKLTIEQSNHDNLIDFIDARGGRATLRQETRLEVMKINIRRMTDSLEALRNRLKIMAGETKQLEKGHDEYK